MKIPTLPEYLKAELRKGQYCALYAAGPIGVVAKRLGDNRGCRPIKFGITTSWTDTVTANLDAAHYAERAEVLFRVWCGSVVRAKLLKAQVEDQIESSSMPMRKGWFDLGPELDLTRLENAVRTIAREWNVHTWSDGELKSFLSANAEEAKVRKVQALRRGAIF